MKEVSERTLGMRPLAKERYNKKGRGREEKTKKRTKSVSAIATWGGPPQQSPHTTQLSTENNHTLTGAAQQKERETQTSKEHVRNIVNLLAGMTKPHADEHVRNNVRSGGL